MVPQVTLVYDIAQGLYHPAALHAGLDALARKGIITLQIRPPRDSQERQLVELSTTLCLKIESPNAAPRIIAIDLHDMSDLFAMATLAACSVYLKRSFHPPDVARLPAESAAKVRPYGLNYACRTRTSTLRILRAAGARIAMQGIEGARMLRGLLALPTIAEFEMEASAPTDPTIVFQTRVWLPEDTAPGEDEEINRQRVELIRALRKEFKDRFIGGLVPTPLAQSRYPDDLSAHSSRRRLYTAMSKRSLIGVYSRGLHQSNAFKLPEYLAASQCIVAEPPRNGLPIPLDAGKHFLPFQTADECVAACRRLLEDRDLALAMRKANQEYYRAEVEPAAHMTRVFDRCGVSEPA